MTCKLSHDKKRPTILGEDNTACITHVNKEYIKGDRTKHISLSSFSIMYCKKKNDISDLRI